jgi:hypothetical protein
MSDKSNTYEEEVYGFLLLIEKRSAGILPQDVGKCGGAHMACHNEK